MVYFFVYLTGVVSGLIIMFLFVYVIVRVDKKKRSQKRPYHIKDKHRKRNAKAENNVVYLSEYKKKAKLLALKKSKLLKKP